MTIFESLLVSHLIGDWLLQTEYQALNKAEGKFFNRALLMHCITYTLSFLPAMLVNHVSLWWIGWIFWTHMFIDRRWPIVWWIKHLKRSKNEIPLWLVIMVDQVVHVLVFALVIIVC